MNNSFIKNRVQFLTLALIELGIPSLALANPLPPDESMKEFSEQIRRQQEAQNIVTGTKTNPTPTTEQAVSRCLSAKCTIEQSEWFALVKFIGLLAFVVLLEIFTAYLYLKKRKKSLNILWTIGWVNIVSLPLAWILMTYIAEILINSLLVVLFVEFIVVIFESFFVYVFNFKHINYLESVLLTILTNFISLTIGGIILYLVG